MPSDPSQHRLAAILSADAVGYSRLMGADEEETVRTIQGHLEAMGDAVEAQGGRVVDATGDNLLAEFASALGAVEAAVAAQEALTRRNEKLAPERRMPFRIGIHLGEIRVEGEHIYGDGVNVAARLEPLAPAGGLCLSEDVHRQVRGKLPLAFEDLGEQRVKNIAEPVRVYRVRLAEAAGEAEAAAPVPGSTTRFAFADFVLDADRFELSRTGEPIDVQPKVLHLLLHLLRNAERTVPKDELLEALWPDTVVSEGSLTRAVNLARVALGETQKDAKIVQTVHRLGYKVGVPVTTPSAEAAPQAPAPAPRPASDFVGRDRELAEADETLAEVLAGRGQVLLLAGEPGIGKTRLAEEIVERGRGQGIEVLWGRCYEGEGGPAFWPWMQILRCYVEGRDAETLRAQLGRGAPDVAEIVPEVRERLPDLPEPSKLAPEQARFRFFDSVTTTLKQAATGRPVMLVLDDLHWADESSLRLLEFLAPELGSARLLLLGTYRDAEVSEGHPLGRTLGELARTQQAKRTLRLRSLSDDEVESFVSQMAGAGASAALTATVRARAEGNPLFARELVRWLSADASASGRVPEGVREVIGRRLEGLSPECRSLLTTASVIGRDFGLALLSRASDASEEALLDPLDEAEDARIVGEVPGDPGRFRFSHALVRETLYDGLRATRRARAHLKVGGALEALGGEPAITELAHHFAEAALAGGRDKAVRYSREAADRANEQFAWEDAAQHYERALRLVEAGGTSDDEGRGSLYVELAEARRRSGAMAESADACRRAIGIARTSGSSELLARAAVALSDTELGGDHQPEIFAVLEEALEATGGQDSVGRALVLAELSKRVFWLGDVDAMAARGAEAVEVARRVGDPATLYEALHARLSSIHGREEGSVGRAICDETLRLAEELGDLERAGRAHLFSAHLHVAAAIDPTRVDEELEACARIAEELRLPLFTAALLRNRASRALREGRYDEAERLSIESFQLERRLDINLAIQALGSHVLDLRRAQGRLGELEGDTRRGIERFPRLGPFRTSLALILTESGRLDEARDLFEELASRDFDDIPRDINYLFNLGLLTEVCTALRDAGRASILYERAEPHRGGYARASNFLSIGSMSRYLGMLAATLGRFDDSERSFEEALVVERRMRARPWEAYALADYAAMLLRRGRPGDRDASREKLDEALAIAKEIGAAGIEQRARRVEAEV